jgi:FixJ family two-component response regulator
VNNPLPLIQIIDDDPSVVLGLKRLLRACGMQIQTFASGEEFLTREKPKEADCIIIDIQMPGMTGLDVQAHLNNAGSHVPLIFMTAYATEDIEEQALRAGAIGFLKKPIPSEKLIELIRVALQHPGKQGH